MMLFRFALADRERRGPHLEDAVRQLACRFYLFVDNRSFLIPSLLLGCCQLN